MILAGGSGRRLGHVDKPALVVGGVTLLARAMSAVAPARTLVVGPPRDLPGGVRQVREDPPGGGPAAALVAGLTVLALDSPNGDTLIAVLAADLPGISATAVATLCAAVRDQDLAGAVLTDPDGRRQYLAGVWRWGPLSIAANGRDSWHGGRLSDLLGPLIDTVVAADRSTTADIDTPADLRHWTKSGRTGPSDHD